MSELKNRNDHKCQGKNCHAGKGNPTVEHSLECQEQATYTFAGQPQPEILRCEEAVYHRWEEIKEKVSN